jgi:hypothetical protein
VVVAAERAESRGAARHDRQVPESIKNIPPARKTASQSVERMTATSHSAAASL